MFVESLNRHYGWLYLVIDLVLRTVYVGSTVNRVVPVRAGDHLKLMNSNGGRYTAATEVLVGYAGFGPGRRHQLVLLQEHGRDTREELTDFLREQESRLIAPHFIVLFAERRYKTYRNMPNAGYGVQGVRSYKLKRRRVVHTDTVFKLLNQRIPTALPARLYMRLTNKMRNVS